MKNLSVTKKLGLGFGLVILILIAMSSVSLVKLSAMNSNVASFADSRLPKAVDAGLLDAATSDYRTAIANHIIATDTPGIVAADKRIVDKIAAVEALQKSLGALLVAPDTKAKMQEIVASWQKLNAADRRALIFSRAQQNAEATKAYEATDPLFEECNDRVGEFRDLLSKQSGDARASAAADFDSARNLLIVLILIAVGVTAAALMLMVKQIAAPLTSMTGTMNELAAGKLDTPINCEPRRDEIGGLAGALIQFRDQLVSAERAKAEQIEMIVSLGKGLDSLANGDLTARIDAELSGTFAKLKTDFNAAGNALEEAITAVTHSASGINTGATEIRTASDDLSHRTEQQAASLEETAAAMNELTNAVRQTAEGAEQANALVGDVRSDAEKGGEVVRRAVQAMDGIERSSSEITEIISVIDGIAFQTNLLALNAGVEAARAGDAGRGFAVVASEVRALAQRSADAAKDVKSRIHSSSEQVENGVELVAETGKSLERIITRINEISTLVARIASSAQQQASGLQQVNTAVGEMDDVTQQNAAMVEEATAAARTMQGEAGELEKQMGRFRLSASGTRGEARPATQPQRRAAPPTKLVARRPQTRGALALAVEPDDDDWSKF